MGSDVSTAPRYYYVYNVHGDVVALTDTSGNVVASYSYDAFGVITSSSESLPNGWSNPYRYDGKDKVRYDGETGLYWMSVRAYAPTLGRFISRDPLGREPQMDTPTQPYIYGDNNPLVKYDPTGWRVSGGGGGGCAYVARKYMHWWGFSMYINHCIAFDLNHYLNGVAALATVVAAGCATFAVASSLPSAGTGSVAGGICEAVAVAVAGIAWFYATWIDWADGRCGNRGVFVNKAWLYEPFIGFVC